MAYCGICKDPVSFSKKFYCPSCTSYLLLDNRISLINSSNERAELAKQLDSVLAKDLVYNRFCECEEKYDDKTSKRHIQLLKCRVEGLQRQITSAQQRKQQARDDTIKYQQEKQAVQQENDKRQVALNKKLKELSDKVSQSQLAVQAQTAASQQRNDQTEDQIRQLQTNLCKDLALLFGVRKRRKKKDKSIRPEQPPPSNTIDGHYFGQRFDLVIAFAALPDLTKLVHHTQSQVNVSIERLSVFTSLLAYYLNVPLPYDLAWPQRSHPHVRMGDASRNVKISLFSKRSVRSLAKDHVQDFENYMEGLAMLSCCVAKVANRMGVPVTTVEEHPQVDKTLSKLYRKLVPRNDERVPRSMTPENEPSPAASVGDISDQVKLTAIRDHIVTQSFLEINGESAVWNLVDYEAAVGSLVNLTGSTVEDSD